MRVSNFDSDKKIETLYEVAMLLDCNDVLRSILRTAELSRMKRPLERNKPL